MIGYSNEHSLQCLRVQIVGICAHEHAQIRSHVQMFCHLNGLEFIQLALLALQNFAHDIHAGVLRWVGA